MLQKLEINYTDITDKEELKNILNNFEFSGKANYNISLMYNLMLNSLGNGVSQNKFRRKLYTIFDHSENSKLYNFGEEEKVNKYLKNKKEPYLLLFGNKNYVVHKINFGGVSIFLETCLEIIDFLEKQNQTSSDLEEIKGKILQILNK